MTVVQFTCEKSMNRDTKALIFKKSLRKLTLVHLTDICSKDNTCSLKVSKNELSC